MSPEREAITANNFVKCLHFPFLPSTRVRDGLFPIPAQANEILRKEPAVSGKNQQAFSLREEVTSMQDHTVNEEDIGSIMPTTTAARKTNCVGA